MNSDLLQKLKDWRRNTANLQGIEPFRVFANKVLENIAELKPKNKEELMAIKGIRDKKFAKYGEEILAIVNGSSNSAESSSDFLDTPVEKPFSVSTYIDFLNRQLANCRARIQGEISSIDIKDRVIYFSLKDSDDASVINCLMWKRDYELNGIEFEIGMEVILEGAPDIYKPSGRLSFKASMAELVGEGALKKAYDQLKKKLDAEGLFLEERKREIPDLPQKIGLITSETGAVIHDFLTNLGKYGFHITFMDSRVEGHAAVRDLVSAIEYFSNQSIDVLVIIRGGGSLESLQAFNNETLVRKIADFNKPVICGIGHEKDVPLASLVADRMVSTPTAVTHVLNKSWQEAVQQIELNKERLFGYFEDAISNNRNTLDNSFHTIEEAFGSIFENFRQAKESLKRSFISLSLRISEIKRGVSQYPNIFIASMVRALSQIKQKILSTERLMLTYSPEKQLKLGYSIVRSCGAIVKKVSQLHIGQSVDIVVADGSFESEVKNIHKK
jgi:exodeoxyribonuclease VII large subunit